MIRTVTDSVSKESAIDEVIATCNGDMRGAIKALLLVNEHLEAELQHCAPVESGSPVERRMKLLVL